MHHNRPLPLPSPALSALQDKKRAEEERQRELASLFAQSIKQPKVPVGESAASAEAVGSARQPPASTTH
jgi:hypothetical protein